MLTKAKIQEFKELVLKGAEHQRVEWCGTEFNYISKKNGVFECCVIGLATIGKFGDPEEVIYKLGDSNSLIAALELEFGGRYGNYTEGDFLSELIDFNDGCAVDLEDVIEWIDLRIEFAE